MLFLNLCDVAPDMSPKVPLHLRSSASVFLGGIRTEALLRTNCDGPITAGDFQIHTGYLISYSPCLQRGRTVWPGDLQDLRK